MPNKLIIIDESDWMGKLQGIRAPDDDDERTYSVKGKHDLIEILTSLVSRQIVFDRVVFRTHGWPGLMWLGDDEIVESEWFNIAGHVKLPALFPGPTKVYFDGCVIADGELGTEFLLAAGQHLLRGGGGSVSGWTSLGFAIPGFVPFYGSHTIHLLDDDLKTYYFEPGGRFIGLDPR